MSYGDRLRAKRKEKGFSQEKLAEMISAKGFSVTGSYISMIERGYDKRADGEPSRPARALVELAAKILEDDVDEALMDADYAPIHRPLTEAGFYSGMDKIPPHLRSLADKQIQAIIDSLAAQDDHEGENF